MYLTQEEINQAQELKNSLNENNITYKIAEVLLGEYAVPEYIMEISDEMQNIPLNEYEYEYFDKPDTVYRTDEDGPSLIGAALGFGKHRAKKLIRDPKTASVCLRALRDKYEEVQFTAARAKAEKRGFFATILFTIKKAMYWIIKKFGDMKDSFFDLIKGRKENSSKAKRDYIWLTNQNNMYLANNTDWFLDSEH